MFVVRTTDGVLAGPGGKPYPTERGASADAERRNDAARALELKVRYVVGKPEPKNLS